jgi:hypothetical protein
VLNTLLLESQLSGSIKHIFWRSCRGLKKKKFPHQLCAIKNIFWRRYRGTSRRIAYKKVFITNLCKRLILGRLHLHEYHLVLLDFQSTLFLFCYCLAYHFFYFQFCITFLFRFAFYFSFCILFITFYFGCISCSIILLSVFIQKLKAHKNLHNGRKN